jgi:hypothetical protein
MPPPPPRPAPARDAWSDGGAGREDRGGDEEPPPEAPPVAELSVKVGVRVRPLMAGERVDGAKSCLRLSRNPNEIVIGKDKRFTFDAAYAEDTNQTRIFEDLALPLVDNLFEGYNATLFAYGQTGSGKTYTMGSSNKTLGFDDEVGMIPRVVHSIFERLSASPVDASTAGGATPEFLIRASFIEIYNEELKDLLHPATSTKDIAIREDGDGSIILAGVKEQVVSSYEDTMRCIESGCVARTTATTGMNDQSSRSHAIFTLIYERLAPPTAKRKGGGGAPAAEYITSKFHMVDLAGSERNKRTRNVGGRFKESVAINYGLLALGNVISALGDEKKRGRVTHVPYRESKLTRILQDSLGGNSNTVMIACASPADSSFAETLNTLKYANRARNIKNKPVVNRDSKNVQLKQLRSGLQSLQMDLLRASGASGGPAAAAAVQARVEAMLQDQSAAAHVKQLLAQVGHGEEAGPGSELGKVLLQRLRELEAEHTQAKKALMTAEANVVELSEMCLQLRGQARIVQQKVAAARAQCQAEMMNAGTEGLGAAILNALPTDSEMHLRVDDVSDAWTAGAAGTTERQLPTIRNSAHSRQSAHSSSSGPLETAAAEAAAAANAEIRDLRAQLQHARDDAETMKSELEEANSDLQRDERIFNEKMQVIEQLERENAELRDAASAAANSAIAAAAATAGPNQLEAAQAAASHDHASPALRNMFQSPAPNSRGAGSAGGSFSSVVQTPQSARVLASMAEDEDDVMLMGEDDESYGTLPGPTSLLVPEDGGSPGPANGGDVVVLESEKLALLKEKAAIEEEKQQIEAQANFDKRHFHVNKQRMEKTLMDLTVNIRLKEELIAELSKNEQDVRELQAQYEEQMQALVHDRDQKEGELAKAQGELQGLESAVQSEAEAKNAEQRRQMKLRHEAKVESLQKQIATLQQAEREQKKVLHAKLLSERQVAKLTNEIEKMRGRGDSLKSKLRENAEKYDSVRAKQDNELTGLRKETENFAKKIRQLERENSRQRQRLKAKEEEVARLASGKQHRGSRAGVGRSSGASSSFGRPSTAPVRSGDSSSHNTPDRRASGPAAGDRSNESESEMQKRLAEQKAMLDAEVEKHLVREEATKRLESELEQREAAIAEKESALAERHALELRRMRNSHSMNENMVAVNTRLETLQEQLEQGGQQAAVGFGDDPMAAAVAGRMAEAEVSALRMQQEAAYRERAELTQRAESRQFLSSTDEQSLFELEDRVETLDAQIEYKSQTIREAEAALAQLNEHPGRAASEAGTRKQGMGAGGVAAEASAEVRAMMDQYVGAVVDVKQERAEAVKAQLVAEQRLQEREAQIEELENFLRQQELELDRQLTQQAKEHELKTQYLLKQIKPGNSMSGRPDTGRGSSSDAEKVMRMKEEQISALEKDVFYYKHKKQELESHIKDIVHAGDATLAQAAEQESELDNLRNANRALVVELGNTKTFLHQQLGPHALGGGGSGGSGGGGGSGDGVGYAEQAHAIRISRSQMQQQLRPLSREELQSRAQRQAP